ncbi:SusC/RagA family TonB-linked outer membrane protein [Flammeovirga yaeyamensis]|uniref:SusC/RagA family TonB-linked outer membrane protein n=1 Tax=Flammeovirga yaeyamensis TaxID=367791 RepID=A0AAX1NB20_9BACT|nr:TonB-dependent receptor [Flammeovirga yaeyamensis]MBB3697809.1 TonB-linked SusC/RagA family outer membrane protein [Flammeovirga yaeyamensis]NMF35835.1 TonB-dependent receptor [Flammeovirga yaeyamensis]QWG03213.1 SusC/RagA family TonB-linked outer membrane protein [Flammeovirga yaeyamensis]
MKLRLLFIRLKVVLLLLIVSQFAGAAEKPETQQFNFNFTNTTLEVVFEEIESTSSYRFFYNPDAINTSERISINAQNLDINSLMDKVLMGTDIGYHLQKHQIALYEKSTAIPVEQEEQDTGILIEGRVTDENQMPIVGASIIEKGTFNGIVTQFDGQFKLKVKDADAEIEISSIGYFSQTLKVGSQTKFDVSLQEDVEQLEEVIVVGYSTQKKENVTGSVAAVKGDDIVDVPATTISNSLAGRMPGVIVTNSSGAPGADEATIRIRGFDNPLVIVDGVETEFNRLDPNDIASISVLKDASAAIYGARAGNGVILVTTKRGQAGKTTVKLSTSYGAQSSIIRPEYVNATQYMDLVNDYAPGTYLDDDYSPYLNGQKQSTDWYGETFRDSAPIFRGNVNVSGGSEKVRYFLSYGYMDQASILQSNATNYNQHNIRSNINVNLTNNLELRLDLAYRQENRMEPGVSLGEIMTLTSFSNPMVPAYYPDRSYPVDNGSNLIGPNFVSRRDVSGYNKNDYGNTSANVVLNYKMPFLKGMSAKAFFNYTAWDTRGKHWQTDYSFYHYDESSDIYSEIVAKDISQITLTESYNQGKSITSQFFLNYDKTFGDHTIGALLLGEFISSDGSFVGATRGSFISSAVDQMYASSTERQNTEGFAWQDGRASFVGRLNYNYKEKYLAEATFRYDASPRFSEDHRWGLFPSFSLGWRISEENFLKNSEIVDNLKVRASVGKSGYDGIGNFNYLTGYIYGDAYVVNGSPTAGLVTKGMANPKATWETMTMYNVGVDFGLFKGIIYGEFDAFMRTREDILGKRDQSLPSTFGAYLPDENINSQVAQGFELLLGHKKTIKNFKYDISGNVSVSKSKWDHYDEPEYLDDETRARYQQSGQYVNRYFGYKALGLFTSDEEIKGWADQDGDLNNGVNHDIQPGDIKYLDYNGDGIINDLDKHVIGKGSIPEIFYGINVMLQWKNFDFSMLWQGASGFNVVFSQEAQQPFYNKATPLAMFMDRWTEDNNDPNAKFPRTVANSGNPNNYDKESSFWLQDGSYFRLKNVSLGYSLPTRIANKIGMENLRASVSGLNLFTFTDVYPFDPETPTGGRGWDYPQQKTVMMKLDLTF